MFFRKQRKRLRFPNLLNHFSFLFGWTGKSQFHYRVWRSCENVFRNRWNQCVPITCDRWIPLRTKWVSKEIEKRKEQQNTKSCLSHLVIIKFANFVGVSLFRALQKLPRTLATTCANQWNTLTWEWEQMNTTNSPT